MTGIGTSIKPIVEAIKEGRSTNRFRTYQHHAAALSAISQSPDPSTVLRWLEMVLSERMWRLYRPECVLQLRAALRECDSQSFAVIPELVAAARTRARHRGRTACSQSIGTPLLVKGLEFDHAILIWEPNHLSLEGLYVALTRASRSLTIISRSRTLIPALT